VRATDVRAEGPDGPGEGFGDGCICGERGVYCFGRGCWLCELFAADSMDVVVRLIAGRHGMYSSCLLLDTRSTDEK
jgi:hypothetical protein